MPEEYRGAATQTYRKLYGYKKILAWQKADDLSATVHETTRAFGPGYWRLADQMRGAAVSVKCNIAEGYCRASIGDYVRFCEIARGSLGELGSQIQDCERWGLLSAELLTALLAHFGDATYFLERLIAALKKTQRTAPAQWDRSFGSRESEAHYSVGDDSHPFELPDDLKF